MPLFEPRRLLWSCFAVALLLPEQQAEAEPSTAPTSPELRSVVVSSPRCEADSFPLVAFLDSLRVELAGRGLHCCALAEPGDGVPPVASLRVTIDPIVHCATDRVQIAVQGPDGSSLVEREISLTDVAEAARLRALALAVAELIRSIGQAKGDEKKEAIAVSAERTPPPSSPSPPPVVTRAPALSMRLEAEVRDLPMRDTVLWGGRARLTAFRRSFHADLDLGANYSDARVELGDVVLESASIGLGFGPRLVARPAIIDLGLRAELGWAWVHGKPAFPDVQTGTGSGMVSSAGFRVSVEGPTEAKIRPGLALESGAVLRGMKGDVNGQTVTGITGYYLLAAVGMGVSL
jgi:hypothetical protein